MTSFTVILVVISLCAMSPILVEILWSVYEWRLSNRDKRLKTGLNLVIKRSRS
jgi:hypothetical protein